MTLKETVIKIYHNRIVRFLFVGVLNTIVGIGITLIVYACFGVLIFSEKEDIPFHIMIIGTMIGQVVGTVHSYFWNKYFTFQSKKKSGAEFLRFVLVYIVQYCANLGLTALFNLCIQIPVLVTVMAVLICTCLSYFGHTLFSFRNKKEQNNSDCDNEKLENNDNENE